MNDLSKVIYASQEYVNDLIKESGIIHKEGILVQEDCLADRGISVITELEPKQEGTGNPYPAGGSKNLFNKYNYTPLKLYINVDTKTYLSYTDERVIVIPIKPNTTYTVKKSTTTVMRLATSENYPGNKVTFTNWIIFTENNGKGDGKLTITSGANDAYLAVQLFADADLDGSYGNISANINDLQIEEGSTATDYEPGSNIRPFVGYNTINITRSGKNLFNTHVFDKHDFKSVAITTKTITDNSITLIGVPTSGYCYIKNFKAIECAGLAGKTLTVSATISGNEPRLGIQCYNKDDVKINDYFLLTTGSKTFTLPDDCAYLGYICYLNRGSYDLTTQAQYTATYSNIQLEVSEAVTDYEPYKGETFTMSLGDTYYGGSLDWNTGELIVDKYGVVLNGSENWAKAGDGTANNAYRFYLWESQYIPYLQPCINDYQPHETLICSHYTTLAYMDIPKGKTGIGVNPTVPTPVLGIYNPLFANSTVDEFKAELAKEPITIVYGLANPIKIQLASSFNIKSLEGTNILYSSPSLNNIIDFNRDSYAPNTTNKMNKNNPSGTGSFSMNRIGDIGKNSATLGTNNTASGVGSLAEGYYTIAAGDSQHVEGKYNIEDTTSAHIIGNGSSNTKRSNAHTLDWNGNAWFQGDVYVGSTSGKNKDEGSQKLIKDSELRGTKLELESYVSEEFSKKGIIRKEGTIVQHDCNENMGISIASYLTPMQEGSGDPYPAGGGKNLLPGIMMGAAWMSKDGTLNKNQSHYTSTEKFPVEAGKTYVDSTDNNTAANRKSFHYWDANGVWLGCMLGNQDYTINNRPDGAVMAAITYYNPDATQIAKWAQVEEGTTATAYEPYSNIRPIVGYNNISITKSGKNQLPYPYPNAGQTVNGITYTVNSDGSIKVNGTPTDATKWSNFSPYPGTFSQPATMFFLPAGSYKLVCERANIGQIYPVMYKRTGPDNTYELVASLQNKSSVEFTTTEDSDKYYLLIGCRPGYAPSNETLKTIIVSASETDFTYEAYKGETFTMALGSTYYGGSVNWNTGEFIIDKAYVLFTGLEDINLHTNFNNTGTNRFNYPNTPTANMNGTGLCSHMTYGVAPIGSNEINNRICGWKNGGLYWRFDSCATKEEMKAYMEEQYNAGTPVQVVYTLAEPIKIQLDSSFNIQTLDGINTIFGNPTTNNIVDFNRDAYVPVTSNNKVPVITYSTIDLIAGESLLAEGEVYLVYE